MYFCWNDVYDQHTYSEVKQADPYASGKQHGEVRRVFEFRFFIRFSQFHVAVFGEVQDDNKHCPGVLGTNVHPGKGTGDPRFPLCHMRIGRFWFDHAPNDKAPNNRRGDEGNHWIQANVDSKVRASQFAPFPVHAKPATSTRGIFVFTASTASTASISIHFRSSIRFRL